MLSGEYEFKQYLRDQQDGKIKQKDPNSAMNQQSLIEAGSQMYPASLKINKSRMGKLLGKPGNVQQHSLQQLKPQPSAPAEEERKPEQKLMTVEEFMALPNRLAAIQPSFIPKDEMSFRAIFRKWLTQFHDKYMVESMDESRLTETQKELYLVGWNNCREKLAPDIEGNVVKSIIKTSELN